MDEDQWLAGRFEEHRARLRAVAYRMPGSLSDADDAVQESWLRMSRAGADEVGNLAGWLTTITSRVCLNMLRSRRARPEEPLGVHVPDPVISRQGVPPPEEAALLADSVGLALLVVLDTLTPEGFTIAGGKISEIDAIADPGRVRKIAAAFLDDGLPYGVGPAPAPPAGSP